MTTLRFTPPSAGLLANAGRIDVAANWSPAAAPGPGDTAIITGGTLYVREETLSGLGLFAFTTSIYTGTGPELMFRNVTVGASSTLVVEGDLFVGTGVGLSQTFENDGRVELSSDAGFGGADGYRFVNRGTIVLNGAMIAGNTAVENDGVMRLENVTGRSMLTNISGSGTIVVAPGNRFGLSLSSPTQRVVLAGGTAAHTTVSVLGDIAAPVAGFVAGDTITYGGFYGTPTSVSLAATGPGVSRLTVSSGSSTAILSVVGDYRASDFVATVSPLHVLSVTTTRTDTGIDATTAIYRFFNTMDGTHFFTASTAERDTIVNTRPDLAFEGVTLNAADPNGASAPIYRFFDTVHGTHFYTADSTERDAVQATRPDLAFEGTAFSEHLTAQPGDTPVYRFFDTRLGTHFYTASASEAATTIQTRADLTPEGISFYAPS